MNHNAHVKQKVPDPPELSKAPTMKYNMQILKIVNAVEEATLDELVALYEVRALLPPLWVGEKTKLYMMFVSAYDHVKRLRRMERLHLRNWFVSAEGVAHRHRFQSKISKYLESGTLKTDWLDQIRQSH